MTDSSPAESTDPEATGISDALTAAARKSAFGQVTPGEAPSGAALLAAIGGVRGIIESILPGLLFLIVYTLTQELLPSVLIPLAIAVVFVVARVATRSPATPAIVGAVGIAASALLAIISGRASENFLLGFYINGAWLLALFISLIARWPLVGVIVGLLRSEGSTWRNDKAKFRVAVITTWLWVGLFGLRLAVELPLYVADETQWLAGTKLLLGLPLYAGMLWVTWLLVRAVYARDVPRHADAASDHDEVQS